MRLYLIRHGQAHDQARDPQRNLTPMGRQEVQRVAQFLAPLSLSVQSIHHSGKPRAAQTAAVIAEAIAAAEGAVAANGLNPGDPVQPIADRLIGLDHDVVIVGHLPFLGRLAALLLVGDAERDILHFATASAACLASDDGVNFQLLWLVAPGMLP